MGWLFKSKKVIGGAVEAPLSQLSMYKSEFKHTFSKMLKPKGADIETPETESLRDISQVSVEAPTIPPRPIDNPIMARLWDNLYNKEATSVSRSPLSTNVSDKLNDGVSASKMLHVVEELLGENTSQRKKKSSKTNNKGKSKKSRRSSLLTMFDKLWTK